MLLAVDSMDHAKAKTGDQKVVPVLLVYFLVMIMIICLFEFLW